MPRRLEWQAPQTAKGECAGWYFKVCTLLRDLTNKLFQSLVPSHWRRALLAGASGTVVPLFTSAASGPQRPSHTGAGNAPHSIIPKTAEFGGFLPPPTRGGQGGGGLSWQ